MRSKTDDSPASTFLNRARRRQFVTCATQALAELGYAATTIAEVARRADVSKSVVLYHFSSRDQLMEAVVEQLYGDAVQPIHAAVDAARGARERVLAYTRACVEFVAAHRAEARAVQEVARNLRRPDGTPRYTALDGAAVMSYPRELLEAGQRSGELGGFDPWTLAVLLRAGIDGLAEQFTADPGVDAAGVADHLVTLVDKMITPEEKA